MKKTLITGGEGFIGVDFIKYMIDKYKDYSIFNLDLLNYEENLNNLKEVEDNKSYKFVKVDVAYRNLIFNLFKNVKFDKIC